MILESEKDIETYREAFHSGLRSEQIYGYVGKIRKSGKFSFFITNRKHYSCDSRERRGGQIPIQVHAYGKAAASSSGVLMQARFWYGLCLWELLIIYVGTFLITWFVEARRYTDVPLHIVALCALGYTVAFEILSLACSVLSMLGSDDRRELEDFFLKTLEQEEL